MGSQIAWILTRDRVASSSTIAVATNDFRAGLVTSMLVSGGGSGGGAGPGVSATKEHLAGIIDEVGTRCTHCNEHLRVPR